MATSVMSKPVVLPRGAYDRVFYGGMAVVMALTVLIGFAPTYYLSAYFGSPRDVWR